MIYKCANIQKKLELEKYLFQGSKYGYTPQSPDLAVSADSLIVQTY
jgi:hypothetical protein